MTDTASLTDRLNRLVYPGPARLHAIIQKPAVGVHAQVEEAVVVKGVGLVGDHHKKDWWKGERIPGREVTAVAREVLHALGTTVDTPGDNLVVEGLDLRQLQPGTKICIGPSVILERAQKVHRPCTLFAARISEEARKAVSEMTLRGALFSVVQGGTLKRGDALHIIG